MGAALTLALVTLLAAMVAVVLLRHIRTDPATRESRLFDAAREHDATLQESIEAGPWGPAWLRLNLRDGHFVHAVATSEEGSEARYLLSLSIDADPTHAPTGAKSHGKLFEARRLATGERLEEPIALADETGRLGSMVPTDERRLGLPWEWRLQLAQTVLHLRGRTLYRDARPLATLVPGPFPRIAYVSWEASTTLDERVTAGAALLLLRWTEWLLRNDRLQGTEE